MYVTKSRGLLFNVSVVMITSSSLPYRTVLIRVDLEMLTS